MLITETDVVLKTKCPPYVFDATSNEDRDSLMKRMLATMTANNGVGLAAPQIGEIQNVFVMLDLNSPLFCFNPKIVQQSDEGVIESEGCLSFPDLWLNVTRPVWVIGEYQDDHGNPHTRKFEGMAARCFVHELEHLGGICFVDKVGPVKLALAKTRRIKLQKARKK